MCAATAVGWYPSIGEAVRGMSGSMDTFTPIPSNADLYERLYQNVYKRMYRSLAPLYEEIRKITGYPERPGADR